MIAVPAIQKRSELSRGGCKKFNAHERQLFCRRAPHDNRSVRFVNRAQEIGVAVVNRPRREQDRSTRRIVRLHSMIHLEAHRRRSERTEAVFAGWDEAWEAGTRGTRRQL